jgi:hypothetical protein
LIGNALFIGFSFASHRPRCIIEPLSQIDTALRIATFVVKQGRPMYGKKNITAFPAGLIQDHIPITIHVLGAQPFHQSISVNQFFKREEK